jgi:hypothetical protein
LTFARIASWSSGGRFCQAFLSVFPPLFREFKLPGLKLCAGLGLRARPAALATKGHRQIMMEAVLNMRLRIFLPLTLALAISAQGPPNPPDRTRPGTESEDPRLPNGKSQRDEILKADYQKSLEDARELSRLAEDLKTDLEKNDRYVLSLATLKRTEDIEKLAKRIHDRLKH